MIAGIFDTDFGELSVVLKGTPTPEQIHAFLPHFEQVLNHAVAEYLQTRKEANSAASN